MRGRMFKWRRLPAEYIQFLRDTLSPGATVYVLDCKFHWPVRHYGERHVFQFGGAGGMSPEEYHGGSERIRVYLEREGSPVRGWQPPSPDDWAPEAEWGFEPQLMEDLERLAQQRGLHLRRIVLDAPEDLSQPVADLYAYRYRQRGMKPRGLLGSSFILM